MAVKRSLSYIVRSSQSSFSLGDNDILILVILDSWSWILGARGLLEKSAVSNDGASFRHSISTSENK